MRIMLLRIADRFSSHRGPWLAGVIGIVLCLPALRNGLIGDDHLWWLVLQRHSPLGQGLPPLLHVYNFIPAGLDGEVLKASGMLTWWADPNLRIALFRPLTVLTMMLDHVIAPRAYWLHHLHSLLWYGGAVAAVGWMFRRIGVAATGGTALAGLAMLVFAVDDSHAIPAAWIANRHALVALVFCALILALHVYWRRTGHIVYLAGALVGLALGLTASEAVLGVTAYIGAWQFCRERTGWRRRLAGLIPYTIVVVAWRIIYNRFGFGIAGSGLYLDPVSAPLDFSAALLERWPVMQTAYWFPLPIDVVMFLPPATRNVITVVCIFATLSLLWLFAPLFRRSAEARFWALGMSLALIPLCAAFPMMRNLIIASIGGAALLALQAQAVGLLSGGVKLEASRGRRWLTVALLVVHLPLAAASLTLQTANQALFASFFSGGDRTVPDVPEIEQQSLIFVTGHEFPTAYTPIYRWVEGRHAPQRTALLATISSDNHITREDANTLVIEPEAGYLSVDSDCLERSASTPFTVGETFWMPDFDAEVRSMTNDGRARAVAFRFREPLDSVRYRLMMWGPRGSEPFEPPVVGDTVVLPARDINSMIDIRRKDE
jgi:hypothetical protein